MFRTTLVFILVFVCVLGLGKVQAQDPRLGDSLYKDLVAYGVRDTTYFDKLQELEISLIFAMPDSVFKLCMVSKQLADSLQDTLRMGKASNTLANCYKIMGLYDQAAKEFMVALDLFEALGDQRWLANIQSNLSSIQIKDKQYSQAIATLMNVLKIRTSIGYFKGISGVYNSLGTAYSGLDNDAEALHYYELALDSAITEHPLNRGIYLGNVGNTYGRLGQYAICRDLNLEALRLHEELQLPSDMSRDLHNVGEGYLFVGMIDSALYYNRLAYAIADSIHDMEIIHAIASNFQRAYVKLGDYEQAYKWAEKVADATDSIAARQLTAETKALNLMYKLEQEQQAAQFAKETSLLQKDAAISRQRILLIFMGLFALGLAGFGFVMVRRNRERKQANARLEFKVAERTQALSDANAQLSQEIQAKDDAQQALNTFIYRSSHDLRGPLTSMMGLVDVAKAEPMPSPYIGMIGDKADQLDGVLQQLVDKVEVDGRSVQPHPVDLPALLQELLAELATRKGFAEVRFDSKVDGLPQLETDGFLLKIALRQLLANAVDFRRKGAADNVCTVIAKAKGSGWVIVIQDKGIGIDVNQLPHIFEMFGRSNLQSTGAGLGLYIAKESAQKLGATIQAESFASGTLFSITHP